MGNVGFGVDVADGALVGAAAVVGVAVAAGVLVGAPDSGVPGRGVAVGGAAVAVG
jgi:hypothetical protein